MQGCDVQVIVYRRAQDFAAKTAVVPPRRHALLESKLRLPFLPMHCLKPRLMLTLIPSFFTRRRIRRGPVRPYNSADVPENSARKQQIYSRPSEDQASFVNLDCYLTHMQNKKCSEFLPPKNLTTSEAKRNIPWIIGECVNLAT